MTVTSVLYRFAVDRSAIPYCNSDVAIKVGGRQVGSLKKNNTHTVILVSAYYRSTLLTSAVCHKYCMTVTSVLYRLGIGMLAIPYCNSDVVIKVVGRQVGSLK